MQNYNLTEVCGLKSSDLHQRRDKSVAHSKSSRKNSVNCIYIRNCPLTFCPKFLSIAAFSHLLMNISEYHAMKICQMKNFNV